MSSLENELISACKAGDFEKTKNLVGQLGLLDDELGDFGENSRCLARFLIKNANIESPAKNWCFRGAISRGDLKYARILVGLGVDITAENNTAFLIASQNGDLEMVKFLLKSEPRVDIATLNNYAIRCAATNGDLEMVKFLLSYEREEGKIKAANECALEEAIANGNLEIVKFLLAPEHEPKADITAKDNQAIKWASENEHLEMVKFLLSKGADFAKLTPKHKKYFQTLKWFRRWRFFVFLRRLTQIALPLYYSPGFPGSLKGRISLEEFVGGNETRKLIQILSPSN